MVSVAHETTKPKAGRSVITGAVLFLGVVGLVVGTASVAVLAAALGGDAILAGKIVDAIDAGSTAATIVATIATGAFAGIGFGAVKFAIKLAGKKAAVS
jgi:hypothetical protein